MVRYGARIRVVNAHFKMPLLEHLVITESDAHTAMCFAYPKHDLTRFSQLLHNVTSGDSEYIPRYYTYKCPHYNAVIHQVEHGLLK